MIIVKSRFVKKYIAFIQKPSLLEYKMPKINFLQNYWPGLISLGDFVIS